MRTRQLFGVGWALVCSLAGAACGGSDNDEESNELDQDQASVGCQHWKTSVCDWVERCNSAVTGCREQAEMVVCKSDEQAESCAASLSDASCDSPPTGCDLSDVVDGEP